MQVIAVPCLSLDTTLIERLAASVDYPVLWKIALNNGPLGALDKFAEQHPDWIVKDIGNNLGTAGAWNYAAQIFQNQPTIFFMNEDSHLSPGYLELVCKCADGNEDAPLIHLNDSNAYYAFVATRSGREKFGTFDENFFVCYNEDTDMRVRHRLMGVTSYPYALQGLPPLPHGKPRTGGVNYAAMIQGCGLLNRAYWLRKWGSLDFEKALFQNPYRDHRLSPREWVWYPEERAKRYPLWETFMSMNPSIYE